MPTRSHVAITAITQAIFWHPKRKSLVIVNQDADRAFISENPANVSTDGIPLTQNGSLSITKALGGDPTLARWVQTAAGSSRLSIQEDFEVEEIIPIVK